MSSPFALPLLDLDTSSSVPLYRQLYSALREAILDRRLEPGARLPSTRALAQDLGISRQTVLGAFDQLMAEGYLEGRVGAGTYVTRSLPDGFRHRLPQTGPTSLVDRRTATLSRRGSSVRHGSAFLGIPGETRPLRTGLPALDAFPFQVWARLLARHARQPPRGLLGYGDPGGYLPLREAIAAHLIRTRGVRCEARQIIVVAGAQHALDLVARLLVDPGDVVWTEDPVHPGVVGALRGAGAEIVSVPLDAEGIDLTMGKRVAPGARLVHVTPSHQYPLGVTMTLGRRLELLQWARDADAWIVEDDYDSEYRYGSRAVAALQGLDRQGRVLYIGTFATVLFPSLRLGYLVVPPDLVDAFVNGNGLVSGPSPSIEQAALTDFIVEGHFARHLRRTRELYGERRLVLLEAVRSQLSDLLTVQPSLAGMHLVGWLPGGVSDRRVSQLALERGVVTRALSLHYNAPPARGGLVLGYAAFRPSEIQSATSRLASAIQACVQGHRRLST